MLILFLRSRKTLLPVNLHYPSSSKTPHCPSCARELSNTVSSFLLSSREPAAAATNGEVAAEADRPAKKQKKSKKEDKDKEAPLCCGHVVCQTCVDTIVKPSERCSVCEAGIKGDGAGIIPVGKDGELRSSDLGRVASCLSLLHLIFTSWT